MSRGLTDPTPQEPEDDGDNENQAAIRALIMGQNKLHDRLVDLERQLDHLVKNWEDTKEATPKVLKKKWNKGL
jgi:hypothetical protein